MHLILSFLLHPSIIIWGGVGDQGSTQPCCR